MKARILVAMTGAAALLIGAALPPAANAQSVDCETLTDDGTASPSESRARDSLLRRFIDAGVTITAPAVSYRETLRMVCRANNWATDGLARGGDLNPKYNSSGELIPDDPNGTRSIDSEDAAILFYVMTFPQTIGGADATGQTQRRNFIRNLRGTGTDGSFATSDNDTEYLNIVRRAVTLLCSTNPAEPDIYDDHELCNQGG